MEPLASSKRLIGIAVAAVLTCSLLLIIYFYLFNTSLNRMIKPDLPILQIQVQFRNLEHQNIDVSGNVIAGNPMPSTEDTECPVLQGGDIHSPSVASAEQQTQAKCPRTAIWYVKKHPIALTLYFHQGARFLQWWDSQPQIQTLLDNRFSQGLFFGLLQSMKIKAEQLKLNGLQGEFLGHLLRDAITANAELHYDLAHGDHGWVLSYLRKESPFAEQAIPAMAGLLATSAYRVHYLPEPVLEIRIGLQRFFLTELRQRLYLAQSLEALLNVIESLKPVTEPGTAPISLTLRAEAFLNKLVPAVTGTPEWHAQFQFALKDGELGRLQLPTGNWVQPFHAKLFDGVVASIPHDAFAAIASSLYLPPTLTLEDWQNMIGTEHAQIETGPEPGGLGLIWDFDPTSAHGAIGIIVANPGQPQASQAYRQYLRTDERSAECAGGSIFLAATSDALLTRMKEACARQSLSPLDWQRGSEQQRYANAQLISFLNPGAGIRELFLAGGAGNSDDGDEFTPEWKQAYVNAKAAMRRDGDALFQTLPIFSYAGRVDTVGMVELEGQLIAQEEAQ